MKRNKGFTLVELLVVMAIIAILAAIAIPNVQRWIARGRATQAITEIQNMELAITKMIADAGRSNLKDLIDRDRFDQEMIAQSSTGLALPNVGPEYWSDSDFENAVEIYSTLYYALLRRGRGVVDSGLDYEQLLNKDAVRNLGTAYMSDLATDPWGNLYQIYPGPWPARLGPPVFRIYLPPSDDAPRLPGDPAPGNAHDGLTIDSAVSGVQLIDPETGVDIESIGYPANPQTDVFIWSWGANLRSGQARYNNPSIGYNQANAMDYYEDGQEPELMGGGDDINNWDKNQTFMRFYN